MYSSVCCLSSELHTVIAIAYYVVAFPFFDLSALTITLLAGLLFRLTLKLGHYMHIW